MKNVKNQLNQDSNKVGEHVKEKVGETMAKVSGGSLKSGFNIKILAGIPDSKVSTLYAQAYQLYNTGKYRDAIEIFRILILLDSTESKFMMGIAACLHMMKEYNAALEAYTLVTFLDPDNPVPFFHASDCALQLKDKLGAMVALQMALKKAQNKPEFKTLKERAEITLEALKKEVKDQPLI
jgi:type III secretion system low calcium response chaperone LcrH/SycD